MEIICGFPLKTGVFLSHPSSSSLLTREVKSQIDITRQKSTAWVSSQEASLKYHTKKTHQVYIQNVKPRIQIQRPENRSYDELKCQKQTNMSKDKKRSQEAKRQSRVRRQVAESRGKGNPGREKERRQRDVNRPTNHVAECNRVPCLVTLRGACGNS